MSRRSRTKDVPEAAEEAFDKYVEFHRLDPQQIGAFGPSFRIPDEMVVGGRAKWVTYRSSKVDPESLRRPSSPISYIHEHDAGVRTFLRPGPGCPVDYGKIDVPRRFREVSALARLGQCLGYCFVDDDGNEHEAKGKRPLPELYTVPDGKCLIVIQSRKDVLAMMWGGALGVFARGIDG